MERTTFPGGYLEKVTPPKSSKSSKESSKRKKSEERPGPSKPCPASVKSKHGHSSRKHSSEGGRSKVTLPPPPPGSATSATSIGSSKSGLSEPEDVSSSQSQEGEVRIDFERFSLADLVLKYEKKIKSDNKSLEKEVAQLKQRNQALALQLTKQAEWEVTEKQFNEEKTALEQALAEKDSQLKAVASNHQTMIKQLEHEVEVQAEELTDLRKRHERLTNEVKEKDEHIGDIRRESEEKEVKIQSLLREIEDVQKQSAELKEEMKLKDGKMEDLLNEVSSKGKQVELLIEEKSEMMNSISATINMSDELKTREEKLTQLEAQLKEKTEKIDELTAQVKEKDAEITRLTEVQHGLKEALATTMKEVGQVTEKKDELSIKLETAVLDYQKCEQNAQQVLLTFICLASGRAQNLETLQEEVEKEKLKNLGEAKMVEQLSDIILGMIKQIEQLNAESVIDKKKIEDNNQRVTELAEKNRRLMNYARNSLQEQEELWKRKRSMLQRLSGTVDSPGSGTALTMEADSGADCDLSQLSAIEWPAGEDGGDSGFSPPKLFRHSTP